MSDSEIPTESTPFSPAHDGTRLIQLSIETMGNYHPHGDVVIYPTLVRMAQEWGVRKVLIDKQGNFGSIAGLPGGDFLTTSNTHCKMLTVVLQNSDTNTR